MLRTTERASLNRLTFVTVELDAQRGNLFGGVVSQLAALMLSAARSAWSEEILGICAIAFSDQRPGFT